MRTIYLEARRDLHRQHLLTDRNTKPEELEDTRTPYLQP